MTTPVTQTGLEHFLETPPPELHDKRLGLLCNPASVDRNFEHARLLINRKFPGQLKALYAPQHGFFAEKQDNMIESDHLTDPILGIPVYSLYGTTRVPTRDMFDPIDVLLVDLQDAGTRVYTFVYTLSHCMETAAALGKKVLVLDRPNPVNGIHVEGNCLNPDYASFVGRFAIPMRHGLTMGELALLFNHHFNIGCDLHVMPMKHWHRRMFYSDTGLPWVAPSPNLPSPVSAMVYPGQVIWEGTNISEGRGTTQPFEIFGAPFFDTEKILATLKSPRFPGAVLRPMVFEPTSGKWAQTPCKGFQIHVTHPHDFRPLHTALQLLRAVLMRHGEQFAWKQPPYEYEYEKLPFDLILGDASVRKHIEQLEDIDALEKSWMHGIRAFQRISQSYYLY